MSEISYIFNTVPLPFYSCLNSFYRSVIIPSTVNVTGLTSFLQVPFGFPGISVTVVSENEVHVLFTCDPFPNVIQGRSEEGSNTSLVSTGDRDLLTEGDESVSSEIVTFSSLIYF